MKSLRLLLKKPLRVAEFHLKAFLAQLLRVLSLKTSPKIYLSFDAEVSTDGTGAQLQRQITIYSLVRYFGFKYVHQGIKQVAVHPLDPFQSDSDYREYLNRLDKFLNLSNYGEVFPGNFVRRISRLTFLTLLSNLLQALIFRKPRLLLVHEPYPVSEFCPGVLEHQNIKIVEDLKELSSDDVIRIVLHYRQGVGGFAIYPGQNIPREIIIEKFVDRIKEITSSVASSSPIQITVLTDGPESETKFTPPANQIDLWEGTPGFYNGEMTIKPVSFELLQGYCTLPLQVIRGGNPLEAIKLMSTADFLIVGKSSLSFVGGLLNQKGQTYLPKDFWHRPLRNWKFL